MRLKSTAEGAALAFLVTNSRPIRVPAHSVLLSDGARVVATYSETRQVKPQVRRVTAVSEIPLQPDGAAELFDVALEDLPVALRLVHHQVS